MLEINTSTPAIHRRSGRPRSIASGCSTNRGGFGLVCTHDDLKDPPHEPNGDRPLISHIQKFRKQLADGRLCLGTGISMNDPAVAEALAPVVDFLWIDMEHNPMGIETMMGHLIAARAGGAPVLVRVPSSDVPFLKRVLDSGAEGIIVPQVRTADEVRQVVQACRYPPLGTRGWGPRRPSEYGRRSREQIVSEANQQLFVVVQIEHVEAVQVLDEIVAIEGLDGLVVGPHDLSASLGVLGHLEHPKVLAAIEKIISTAHDAGMSVGFGDEAIAENAIRWARMGADWIQPGIDFFYIVGTAEQLFAEIRAGI